MHAAPDGRIRIEAFYRNLNFGNFNNPASVNSAPVPEQTFASAGALLISSVAGNNVVQPPTGNTQNPDVVFSQAGDIKITVQAQNIADGTPVKLRVTTSTGIINKPASGEPDVLLAGGTASFTLTVPKGPGTIQASASFTLSKP
jgi:hypothetical protein